MKIESSSNTENNAEFIYEYTNQAFANVNKSIDIVTDKLTKALAFSGILLKFGYDIKPEGWIFISKFLILSFVIVAIGLCACGLIPKSSGNIDLTPEYLLEENYTLDREKMLVMLCKARIKGILALKKLRNHRVMMFNYAIGCLIFSGIGFGFTGIVSSIH